MPAFERVEGQVARDGRIAAVEDAGDSDPADELGEQRSFGFAGRNAGIEEQVPDPGILASECFGINRGSFLRRRFEGSGTSHVCQNNDDIRGVGKKLFHKYAGFSRTVRSLEIHIGVGVNQKCHPVAVCCAEDLFHLREMCRIVDVDIRIAEVEFYSRVEIGVLCTAIDFRDGIWPERVYRTEADKAVGVPRDLVRRPVILSADCLVFLRNGCLVRIREGVRRREDDGARNVGLIHQAYEFVRGDAIPAGDGDATCAWTVKMLVIIDDLGGGDSN